MMNNYSKNNSMEKLLQASYKASTLTQLDQYTRKLALITMDTVIYSKEYVHSPKYQL